MRASQTAQVTKVILLIIVLVVVYVVNLKHFVVIADFYQVFTWEGFCDLFVDG